MTRQMLWMLLHPVTSLLILDIFKVLQDMTNGLLANMIKIVLREIMFVYNRCFNHLVKQEPLSPHPSLLVTTFCSALVQVLLLTILKYMEKTKNFKSKTSAVTSKKANS